jgi:cytidylate kinase
MSNVIRADGNPAYSMKLLIAGAIINLILDPIFIFVCKWGVAGGAWATVVGQVISSIIAAIYIGKFKAFKLSKKDFLLTKQIFKVLALGVSSFITQLTILVLFVYMNNMMTKFGALTKFGENIPLSVYGVLSKINSIYISIVLGISIGAQPIIGFNYGAGNNLRVKEIIKKLIIINLSFGIIFNVIYLVFPRVLAGIFISPSDPTYDLFMEFAEKLCRIFFMVCGINALEMTSSISIQSLGNVKKATSLSFARQIILFLPISIILARVLGLGLNGILIAGPIADTVCAIYCIIILISEVKKVSIVELEINTEDIEVKPSYKGKKFIVTISREYGSGGRYVGEILARNLGVKFFDKSLIKLIADASGLSKTYVSSSDESLRSAKYVNNNDDRIFIAEERVIKNIAKNESAVIVGRCADYILKDNKNVIKVFLYSDMESKEKRVVKYYNVDKNKARSVIKKINNERRKHYKFYTNREWYDFNNYDLAINVDKQGVEETAKIIENYINGINK